MIELRGSHHVFPAQTVSTMDPTNSRYHPLQCDPQTGELYLRLPPPHDNIIITPPRPTDAPAMVEILSDERVYTWLDSVVHPFDESHALVRLERAQKRSEAVLEEIRDTNGGPFVGGCPVTVLREVKEDGTQVMVGDIIIKRSGFTHLLENETERMKLVEENNERAAGDPDIVWTMADYVAGPYHGRGIMTAAIRTVLHQWAIPRMNARTIRTEVFSGNVGSCRVFQKNGFVLEETLSDFTRVTSAGIKYVGMDILVWKGDSVQ